MRILTVGELKAAIAGIPDSLLVFVGAEGVLRTLDEPQIVDTQYGRALEFDADSYARGVDASSPSS